MLNAIQNRRSHFLKEFNGAKAPKDFVQNVLNAAIWAPSHKLTLPFRFVVYGPESVSLMSAAIQDSFINRNPEPHIEKLAKIQSLPAKLSHAIAIILKPSHRIPLWEEYATLGAAVQNMYLMVAESTEFGAYWTTGNETDAPMMRETLQLTPEEIHGGYFFIGGIDTKRTAAQRPPSEVLWI